ncbi:hypothetical protein DFJ73DRAFT_813376 [Zopfochytrium polystomum]|nr:hypothetical protein DFJ73DRAFT_813376 [Zopfochytrium polystomum]
MGRCDLCVFCILLFLVVVEFTAMFSTEGWSLPPVENGQDEVELRQPRRSNSSRRFLFHKVTPETTVAGLAILYECSSEAIKRENKLAHDDHLQLLTVVKIPLDHCRISAAVSDALMKAAPADPSGPTSPAAAVSSAGPTSSTAAPSVVPRSDASALYIKGGTGLERSISTNGTIPTLGTSPISSMLPPELAAFETTSVPTVPATSWDEFLSEGRTQGGRRWTQIGTWENLRDLEEGTSTGSFSGSERAMMRFWDRSWTWGTNCISSLFSCLRRTDVYQGLPTNSSPVEATPSSYLLPRPALWSFFEWFRISRHQRPLFGEPSSPSSSRSL